MIQEDNEKHQYRVGMSYSAVIETPIAGVVGIGIIAIQMP